jgi:acetolactate synthase I/II/III large subunit
LPAEEGLRPERFDPQIGDQGISYSCLPAKHKPRLSKQPILRFDKPSLRKVYCYMNNAEFIIQYAVKAGIDVCFANPGTTEMPLVNALDKVAGMRAVLGLFEGVCTGAADGYARMAGKPAMTLLHLGPGFGNGIANLHNARRAKVPMFNVVGEHASWHLPFDPLLAMDISALAGSVSDWHRTVKTSKNFGPDTKEAVARALNGQIATLIAPNDFQWAECVETIDYAGPIVSDDDHSGVDEKWIGRAAAMLGREKGCALILGGRALSEKGLMMAARIKTRTGCDLFYDTFPARLEQGAGYPDIHRIPYLPEMALEALKPYENILCLGTRAPVAFFGYEGLPSIFVRDDQQCLVMERGDKAALDALFMLTDALNAPDEPDSRVLSVPMRPDIPSGRLDGVKAGVLLAALQPENAIVVEEAITNSLAYHALINTCPRFTLLALTGGSIGQGPPSATGAAIACPDRPVIDFQADGSAMYTIQSLWTQARENLNVTTLICSNRSYDILKLEMARSGNLSPGVDANRMTDLSGIDWVKLGQSHGVPSVSVDTCEDMVLAMEKAMAEAGPHLIELVL